MKRILQKKVIKRVVKRNQILTSDSLTNDSLIIPSVKYQNVIDDKIEIGTTENSIIIHSVKYEPDISREIEQGTTDNSLLQRFQLNISPPDTIYNYDQSDIVVNIRFYDKLMGQISIEPITNDSFLNIYTNKRVGSLYRKWSF